MLVSCKLRDGGAGSDNNSWPASNRTRLATSLFAALADPSFAKAGLKDAHSIVAVARRAPVNWIMTGSSRANIGIVKR
jgi:hypothetical protein